MIQPAIFKDRWFYPMLFLVWSSILLVRFSDFKYTKRPIPPTTNEQALQQSIHQGTTLIDNIRDLQESYHREERKSEKIHILHNIGITYYHLYKTRRTPHFLDSTFHYFVASLESKPSIPRFYFNMGRLFTEKRDHRTAQTYYQQSIAIDSNYLDALHNLGTLTYFELKKPSEAKIYFSRVIAIASTQPLTSYLLGKICLDEGEVDRAEINFKREIDNYNNHRDRYLKKQIASSHILDLSMRNSHLELARIYAQRGSNLEQMQYHIKMYMGFEPYPEKRTAITKEFEKKWNITLRKVEKKS